MLFGHAPFYSKITNEVCYKTINYKKFLSFPKKILISDYIKDLIQKLICDSKFRLGKNGVQEIKDHPFFKGVNWNKLKDIKPFFIPKIKNDFDVVILIHLIKLKSFILILKKEKKRC